MHVPLAAIGTGILRNGGTYATKAKEFEGENEGAASRSGVGRERESGRVEDQVVKRGMIEVGRGLAQYEVLCPSLDRPGAVLPR